jgi:single-strand DNA-binding protein
MADLCTISLTGRLTRDAEQKTLPTGTKLVTFDIANNTGWGTYAKTQYYTCNVWGKTGENLLRYLVKGKLVAVTGNLEVQKWTSNQDGMEKQKLVVSCRECLLMAGGQKDQEGQSAKDAYPVNDDDYDEEIPY